MSLLVVGEITVSMEVNKSSHKMADMYMIFIVGTGLVSEQSMFMHIRTGYLMIT